MGYIIASDFAGELLGKCYYFIAPVEPALGPPEFTVFSLSPNTMMVSLVDSNSSFHNYYCDRTSDSIVQFMIRDIPYRWDIQDSILSHGRLETNTDIPGLTPSNVQLYANLDEAQAHANFLGSIEKLHLAKLAKFDSSLPAYIGRRTCTENTRIQILRSLLEWAADPNALKIYWMNGMAGTGKTTIAWTLATRLEARKQLAASFFCTRMFPECRDAKRIIPTIAYQLAQWSPPFLSALREAVKDSPDFSAEDVTSQFDMLLRQPLLAIKESLPKNLVIIIDALDECSDTHIVRLFIDSLLQSITDLPIKFYISSRPEPAIRDRMISESDCTRSLFLHEIEKSLVQADIELYIKEELAFMSPGELKIKKLAEHAGNLFIYATTAVRYICSTENKVNSQERLSAILAVHLESKEPFSGLDVLYSAILATAINSEELERHEEDIMRLVLWTAICACEPVLTSTLSALCGLDEDTTMTALESLRSILHVSDRSKLVTTLHASFPNYMFSLERSGVFFCDRAAHNQFLAQQCFDIMKSQLRFNIGDIKSSFIPDSEIPDLGESIVANISDELFYACRFWADHLGRQYRHRSSTLLPEIYRFLSQQLLFWMEVLCLKQVIHIGPNLLLKASRWIYSESHSSPELASLLNDAHDFLEDFAFSPASKSTPNIYATSVRLCSKTSAVYACYSKYAQGWPDLDFCGRVTEYRTLAVSVVPNHQWSIGSGALCVSYSPDGARVAAGCEDGSISIYNSSDDSLLLGPLCEHTDGVRCVIFSPDGAYILSASSDCTIKLWDASNGVPTAAVFQGHTYPVKSVAFSSDGKRIVSGSWDNTVRLWNASDGSSIMEPLEGHKWGVNCVAFSPDDTFVASGASDHTVRLWHYHNTPTSIAFKSHSGPVTSLAFTPDGSRLISGSVDCSIAIWSIPDGSLITHLLQGCAQSVNSIAVSPDGACLASGSVDIRIWEVDTGTPVAIISPTTEHVYNIRSVVFSPDGRRVLSCSHEKAIMLWDLQSITRPVVSDPYLPYQTASTALTEKAAAADIHASPAPTPDGPEQPTVRIWTVRQEELPSLSSQRFARTNIVTSFAWSHDGSHSASCPHFYHERVGNRVFDPDPDHMCLLVFSKDNNVSGTNGSRAAQYSAKLIDKGTKPVEDDTEPNESALRKLLRPFELKLSKMMG